MRENRGGINLNNLFYVVIVIAPISIFLKYSLISVRWFDSFAFRHSIELIPYFLLLSIGYYAVRKVIIKIRKPLSPFTQKVQFVFAIIVFLLSTIFFNRIEILQELIFFSAHRDTFVDLVDTGLQSECYVSGSSCIEYIELSDALVSASGRERIFTLSSFQNQRVIATRSRADVYYVYVPETTSVPKGEKIHQHNIHCFYELEDGWHVCRI